MRSLRETDRRNAKETGAQEGKRACQSIGRPKKREHERDEFPSKTNGKEGRRGKTRPRASPEEKSRLPTAKTLFKGGENPILLVDGHWSRSKGSQKVGKKKRTNAVRVQEK